MKLFVSKNKTVSDESKTLIHRLECAEELLDNELNNLEAITEQCDSIESNSEKIKVVYKEAELNRLTDATLATLSGVSGLEDICEKYKGITSDNQQAISICVRSALEEHLKKSYPSNESIWTVLNYAMYAMIAIDVAKLVSNTLITFVSYLKQGRQYLLYLYKKLVSLNESQQLDDRAIKIIVVNEAQAKVMYKAAAFIATQQAMERLTLIITDVKTGNINVTDEKLKPILNSFGYDVVDNKYVEKPNRNHLCLNNTSFVANGWDLDKVIKSLDKVLYFSRAANVLADTAKAVHGFGNKLEEKKGLTEESTPEKKKEAEEVKSNCINLRDVTKLYVKESKALIKCAISLAKAVLKTV